MNYITKGMCIFVGVLFFLPAICLSREGYEELSKIGFVKSNGANVRAGDNVNFTSLCRLEDGDPVKVVGKRYSWYKIILPRKAYVYIKMDFVESPSKKGEAEINAMRVNLRAGPDTSYAILGQISKPEKIRIAGEENGWYKIIPPEGVTGWIHSSQLRFSIEESAPEQKEKTIIQAEEKGKSTRLMLNKKEPQGNLTFSTQGK
ncbi:MAG: SH3 domain-containing protein [Candidatus Omnitrophota bacterium]